MKKKISILLLAPALLLASCSNGGDTRSQIQIALENNKGEVVLTGSITDKANYSAFIEQSKNYTKVYNASIGFNDEATTTTLIPYLDNGSLDQENKTSTSYFKNSEGLLAKEYIDPTNKVSYETIKDFDGNTQLWVETRSNPFSLLTLDDYLISSSSNYLFTLNSEKANLFASHLLGETVTNSEVSFSVSTAPSITLSIANATTKNYVYNPSSYTYSEVVHTYSAVLDVEFVTPTIYHLQPLELNQELASLESWFNSFDPTNFSIGFAQSDSNEISSVFYFDDSKIYFQFIYQMGTPFMLDLYFEENSETGYMDSIWAMFSETTEELVWIKTSDDPNEKDNLVVPHNKTYEDLSCKANLASSALFTSITVNEITSYSATGDNAKYMSSYFIPGAVEAYTAISETTPEFLRNACSSVKITPDSDGMWFDIEGFTSNGGSSIRQRTRFKIFNVGTTTLPFTIDISSAIDFADFQ